MCEFYTNLKRDFIYRGDVLRSVPFVAYDGKTILVESDRPDLKQTVVPLWKRKSNMPPSLSSIADLQLRDAVVLTRTCEANKLSGVRRVYPAIYLAPIRPLSDFARDGESGEQFAEKIAKGFPPDDEGGDVTECYRFAFMPECREHSMQPGLICFREMQPVHLKYLVDAEKIARLSRIGVHAIVNRFAQFMLQRESDDEGDAEPEGDISSTIGRYRDELAKESTRKK